MIKLQTMIILFLLSNFDNVNSIKISSSFENDAKRLVDQFINYIELYCDEKYSFTIQSDILADLCNNDQIKIINDIPGFEGEETEMNTYLLNLRNFSKNSPVILKYDKRIKIEKCYYNGTEFWGCILDKTVITRNGERKCNEILEIIQSNKGVKIAGIRSNILRVLDSECGNTTLDNNSCKLITLAESELKDNKIELALSHFKEAESCNQDASPILSEISRKINSDSIYLSSFSIGQSLVNEEKYSEALIYFESINRTYKSISNDFRENLFIQINKCKSELSHKSLMESADSYFIQGFYDLALAKYEESLSIKHNDIAASRKKICTTRINENYVKNAKYEIKDAENIIIKDSKFDEGFSVFMKYRHSQLLAGYHYFLMAQIVDSASRKINKEFKLNSRKRCILTRQFMVNAYNLGYRSEGFNIFWNEHLSNRNRTCE